MGQSETILLTGGAGYIGSHTYVALAEAGYRVIILDDFSNAKRSVLTRLAQLTRVNEVTCYEGSVLDGALLRRVFEENEIAAVVHFAARKAVGESSEKPLAYFETNCSGLLKLLAAMEAVDVRRLVFSSTATVYGDPAPELLPLKEDAPLNYMSPYAFTKIMSEQMLEQIAASHASWAFGVLRYFNPVGAHPSGLIGEDPSDIPNNLMPYISKVAAGELPHLNVFGNDYDTPDGTGIRDYIHVSDLAAGHVMSLNRLLATNEGHVVNLGSGQGHSVLEVLAAYGRACGRELPHEIAPRRAGDVAAYYADASRAAALLGFETRRSLDDMCASSWNWIVTGAKEA
ncbi:MAG: UDP-glucose 4-epimerase GalE [Pseudomonadota bacterium]